MKKALLTTLLLVITASSVAAQLTSAIEKEINTSGYNRTLRRLIKETPKDETTIFAVADKMISYEDPVVRVSVSRHSQIVTALLEAGIFLEQAEKYAQAAVDICRKVEFIEQARASYVKSNRPMPESDVFEADYAGTKARALLQLSQGQLRRGRNDAAEKSLLDGIKLDPANAKIAMDLSAIYEKKGDLKAAFEVLLPASHSTGMPKAMPARLADLYKRSNGGNISGFEELLDKKYHEAFPFTPQAFKPSKSKTNRVVLAELISGAGCTPCIAADLAFEGLLKRYKRDDVAVLVYHVHQPLPDPMANPATKTRAKFYEIRGAPTVAFDGVTTGEGTGSPDWPKAKSRYTDFSKTIDALLDKKPGASITLKAKKNGEKVEVSAEISKVQGDLGDLRVHVVLAENEIRYVGENGIRLHPMVVRAVAGKDFSGYAVNSGTTSVSHVFDTASISNEHKTYLDDFEKTPPEELKTEDPRFREKLYAINVNALTVVVFVQNMKTREVLQAASLKLQ